MANDGSNAAAYEAALGQDQHRVETARRPSGNRVDEEVRRFACDRCRTQKLRCERNRLSLHTPLKSTPCRRCIKARVGCTTRPQTRIGRNLDESSARPHRRQASNQDRAPTFDVRPGEFAAGGEDEEEEEEADREAEMEDPHDQQPRTENIMINPINRVIQSPTGLAAKFGPPRAQELDSDSRLVIDPSLLHEAQPMPLYPKSTRPNKGKPVAAKNRIHPNTQQLQHSYINVSNHITSPTGDDHFFEDLDSIIEHNFDNTEGVNWSATSLMDRTNSDSLDQENEFVAGNLESHQGVSQYGNSGGGPAPLINNGQMAAPNGSFRPPGETTFADPYSRFQGEDYHVELTCRMTQLTGTLLKDLDLDQDNSAPTAQQTDKPGNRDSPMSKLLWNVERFLGILGEVSVGSHDFERRRQSLESKNSPSPNAARLHSCGLPGLTTMMAIFAAYSCVLQAYERVFDRMHQTLTRTGRSGSVSLALLPLFQLDSVKFATQNSLQVHVAMEVSLQMLNQIENRLAFIVEAHGSCCEETKACLLALLQSLTYNEEGDSMNASAMIRDTINGVRKLFISEGNFA
ncbi:MAG: hypothetical protein M1839_009402 [Geoglossum umbratile]|nr:MAG: hypothetical protein M1839_009402 [Geoglossum umbratile]